MRHVTRPDRFTIGPVVAVVWPALGAVRMRIDGPIRDVWPEYGDTATRHVVESHVDEATWTYLEEPTRFAVDCSALIQIITDEIRAENEGRWTTEALSILERIALFPDGEGDDQAQRDDRDRHGGDR